MTLKNKINFIIILILIFNKNLIYSSDEVIPNIPLIKYKKIYLEDQMLPDPLKEVVFEKQQNVSFVMQKGIIGDNSSPWVPSINNLKTSSIKRLYLINENINDINIYEKGKQKLFKTDQDLTYKLLEDNRKELLNLISTDEFFSNI